MSAHTPGPWSWVVLNHSPACQLVGSDGTQILTATANDGCEADDNLIAAAPELLEALSMAYELCLQLPTGEVRLRNQRTLCLARDAIAKATGQEPEQVQDDHESYALQSRSAA